MIKKHFYMSLVLTLSFILVSGCTPVPQNSTEKEPEIIGQENVASPPSLSNEAHDESKESEAEIAREKAEYEKESVEQKSTEPGLKEKNNESKYENYTPELLNKYKGKESVVLFFYAPWCPACRAQEKNILENINEFPDGTHILKVDYDSQTELKQIYEVTIQTSFRVLDKNGNVVEKLHDPDISKLKEAISKSINISFTD